MMWKSLRLSTLALCVVPNVFAIDIYLSPPPLLPNLPIDFVADDASAVLSQHLGLEAFNELRAGSRTLEDLFQVQGETELIGEQRQRNVLLLTVDEVDLKAMNLPGSLRHVASLESPPTPSLDSVISTYLHHAAHIYTSLFSPAPSTDFADTLQAGYSSQLNSISTFLSKSEEAAFAAQELGALRKLRTQYGSSSPEYEAALADTHSMIQLAISQDAKIALLAFSSTTSTPVKRQAQPSQAPFPSPKPAPQQPIGSIGTCHTTLDACSNSTLSCSGRGECVSASKAGRTCFVCACGKSTKGAGKTLKTENWVGERCERKDVSGPFVLLAGTTVVLILVVAMSVGLLYGVGNIELPSVLMGGAVHPKKD
ncbi:DUF3844 domain-containing protein [Mycena indigotica]|uniref:DUF3844 domain-containing protein n=1 Tax=Mycena indigotica TaxID=2126181 RepID=A0A8H6TEE6_9AGAR|nr:DUF3844 domain-containing protein [Mycena indigotica]KAF7315945.1 DUF3844 domain-containing protein [Mycena indigotica]